MFSSNTSQVSNDAVFVEDVFSTFLYTGNGSTQTITNGIDLSGKGGLVWLKSRSLSAVHTLVDTARGAGKTLFSDLTNAQATNNAVSAFNANGFTMGDYNNSSGDTFTSWTFRKQPKFFDVVTYTGNGSNARQVSHSLGSSPGFVIIKRTGATGSWWCWHSSFSAATDYMRLNTTEAVNPFGTITDLYQGVSSTAVTIGTNSAVNENGFTYVMYVFASNAGGFGLTGTDNVISCGSFTDTTTVNLGYEPQWVLFKKSSSSSIGDWFIADNMRGFSETSINTLSANTSSAEASYSSTGCVLTSTGFTYNTALAGSGTFIYIAIRRGPMKVPTDATKVFAPVTYTGNGSSQSLTAGFPISLGMFKYRGGATNSFEWFDRLRGAGADLRSAYTYAELATTTEVTSFASNTQVTVGASSDTGGTNASGQTYVLEAFQRAPSTFDEVCYTGNSTAGRTVTHNLGVAPEFLIVKRRTGGTDSWYCYAQSLGNTADILLDSTRGSSTADNIWNSTSPTSTTFTLNSYDAINGSGYTYVAYLWATNAGVTKVGTYTGNGSSQTINCGFTGGARFVMIKATSTTGNWLVADSARGIVSGNDPALYLNSTSAEVTGFDWIDADNSGFIVNETSTIAANTNGVQYLFLAYA